MGVKDGRGMSLSLMAPSPQENLDVFLSAVDTDWKVGPAMRGDPIPGSCEEQQPAAGERCGALSGPRGVAVPPFYGDTAPGWCLCGAAAPS